MTRSREASAISALSLLDVMNDGVPYTFVVFKDGTETHALSRFLKPGFGHCFIVHWDGYTWFSIEKLYGRFEVNTIWSLENFGIGMMNIRRYYDALGFATVEVQLTERKELRRVPYLITLSTCVEVAKDFIGIKGVFPVTPYQLYKHLIKRA